MILKGPKGEMFDIPDDVVAEYKLGEDKVKNLRAKATKVEADKVGDVEGYSTVYYWDEGWGYVCWVRYGEE